MSIRGVRLSDIPRSILVPDEKCQGLREGHRAKENDWFFFWT